MITGWPFREVRRRKVNGGPKATASDEITWAGIWRDRGWEIRTTPRLVDPFESFMTSAGMRLRDSFVGRSGHFVDLVVIRPVPVSDDELAQLEAMAQAIDPRQVVARRPGTVLAAAGGPRR
jgi:hypothetical protein